MMKNLKGLKKDKSEIKYWDLRSSQYEIEQVYGDSLIKWLYETSLGHLASDFILARRPLSQLYGLYQASPLSQKKVKNFIRDFNINMNEFEDTSFVTFNDFFIRRFRSGKRTFIQDPKVMPAFCEGRYFGFKKVNDELIIPVKGKHLRANSLLGSSEESSLAKRLAGGPILIARLCPTDYHRFHFPDQGKLLSQSRVRGHLHSVNPLALRYKSEIFMTNERQVSILETKNFGLLAYIEVGAMMVGKIVQSFNTQGVFPKEFKRGDEKGYFLFGGSTVIVIGEPGRWVPSKEILEQTEEGFETLVQLGEPVARSLL